MGAQHSKPRSSYKSHPKVMKNFSCIFFPQTTIVFFCNIENWNLNFFFFSFSLTGQLKCQNTTASTNRSQKFSNLSWFFPPMVLTKLHCDFWNFEFLSFNEFLLQHFKYSLSIVPIQRQKKINYLEHERLYSEMEWNLGLMQYLACMGYLWLCSVHGQFRLIHCTCDFSEKTISQTLLLQRGLTAESF